MVPIVLIAWAAKCACFVYSAQVGLDGCPEGCVEQAAQLVAFAHLQGAACALLDFAGLCEVAERVGKLGRQGVSLFLGGVERLLCVS